MTWWQRLAKREALERQLNAELQFHLENAVSDNLRSGMSEPEARRRARLQFGGLEQIKEECRDMRGLRLLEDLLRDVRFALRTLRKSPGFTVTAITTMALGIGANVAVFSVVNTVLLKPLNAPEADRIVQIMDVHNGVPSRGGGFPEYNAWRTQSTAFDDISAYRLDLINLTGTTYPELIPVARVSEGFLRLFGAHILRGRLFTADEDRPGGRRVVIISHAFWTRVFANDPQIVGKFITLGNDDYAIVGVLGRGFDTEQFDPLPDVWIPAQIDPETPEHGSYCNVAARLKPSVTLGEARAELGAIAEQYRRKYPESLGPKSTFSAALLRDAMVNDVRSSLLLLAGAVSFVLLIACVNTANLLLVRAEGRKREIAIRAAVGGGPVRILRQLLTESVLLSGLGGVLGILIGVTGVRALLSAYPADPLPTPWNPINLPRIGHAGSSVALDWRVVVFMVLVSLATGVLCGMLPMLQAYRVDLSMPLKENGRSGSGLRHNRTRSLLVVVEMTLALVTLIGAVLLIRSYAALRLVNPGFDAHRVLSMQMSLTATRFEKTAEMDRLVREGTRRIDGLAGVEGAAAACCRPLELVWQLQYIIAGRPLDGPWHGFAGWTFISPEYFDVFHVPVLRGRAFTERDNAQAPGVVIINETLARLISQGSSPSGRDPLNERLIIGRGMRPEYEKDPVRQIVGIVGGIRDQSLSRDPRPAMYVPIAQLPDAVNVINLRLLPVAWFIRTRVQPQSLSPLVQEQLRQVSGGLPIAGIRSMEEVETRSLARQNFNVLLMTIFGCSALLLAAIGIYGLMAYSVQQRTQEIGIRMALGARTGRVRNMVILQGMRLALVGVAAGLLAAYGLARVLSSFLFGLRAHDPITFTAVPILLALVALLACLLPARRATRIDPMEALRWE